MNACRECSVVNANVFSWGHLLSRPSRTYSPRWHSSSPMLLSDFHSESRCQHSSVRSRPIHRRNCSHPKFGGWSRRLLLLIALPSFSSGAHLLLDLRMSPSKVSKISDNSRDGDTKVYTLTPLFWNRPWADQTTRLEDPCCFCLGRFD